MNSSDSLSRALIRAVLLATGAVVALWFLHQILFAILFIVVAVILTLALNPPVVWLEKRKIPRVGATLLVFAALLGVVGGLGALVVPRIAPQISGLIAQIPEYGDQLRERANTILEPYPELQKQLPLRRDGSIRSDSAEQLQPLLETLATRVGNLSLSVLGALVLVSLTFAVLAFGMAFGVLGALIATPLTGFCKAFYEEFYANRLPEDSQQSQRVEAVLEGRSEGTLAPNLES